MSRYTGPRLKKARALSTALPGLTRKSADDRPYPPGQHGPNTRRRRNESDHKRQLSEKQKLRFNYGLREGQMRRLLKEARSSNMATDRKLLVLLESRLDNIVFRAGFLPTIPAARQFVTHGHVRVNGKKLDIPSYRVQVGDTIEMSEKHQKHPLIVETWATPSLIRPDWLVVDRDTMKAELRAEPSADDVPVEVDTTLVVEFYARRM